MKRIIKITALIFLSLSLLHPVSCVRDEEGLIDNPGDGQTEKSFSLYSTKAGIGDEELKTVDLLVFDRSGKTQDNAVFVEHRYAWYYGPGANTDEYEYRAIMRAGANRDVYFAANARDLITGAGDLDNMTFGAMREKLIMTTLPQYINKPDNNNSTSAIGGMPMWGAITGVGITESSTITDLGGGSVITLLRSVASTDIAVVETDNFKFEAGHLVYGADKGYLPYSSVGDNRSPFVPSGMATNKEWRHPESGELNENSIKDIFYMYENDYDTGDASSLRGTHYTKVIIEGKYNDGSGFGANPTYYPITFRNTANNTVRRIIRNYKYTIKITGVGGHGYSDFEDAKNGEDVNMAFRVLEWGTGTDAEIWISGYKFLSLPLQSRSITLYRKAGSTGEITINTNFALGDFILELNNNGSYPVEGVKTEVNNNWFKVTLTDNGGDNTIATDGRSMTFAFTTLKAFEVGAFDNPSVLTVTVGSVLTFKITVTQLDQSGEDWNDGGNSDVPLG